jgi:2-dehydro-3-deoxygluconokinase
VTRVACIGECMIELSEATDGHLSRRYGGDTLNTAIYLARLGVSMDYITALGDDPWSDEMIGGWQAEGVGTTQVVCVPGRLPGLYVIQTDVNGKWRFSYWRESAAARSLFDLPEAPAICNAFKSYDLLYLSGVTLSIYGETGRQRLFDALDSARQKGCRIAFDTNFRPRGWPDLPTARDAYNQALKRSDLIFTSNEDLEPLFGDRLTDESLACRTRAELVIKTPEPACRVLVGQTDIIVAADPVDAVVDTTVAGDSFAAEYLAARMSGATPAAAARHGHRIAGAVVCHRGAIIPRIAMPDVQAG